MPDPWVSALIAASGAVIVASLTFAFNRKLQSEADWRTQKLEYYKELMDALAQCIEGEADAEHHREFARASNNLLLVASQPVLEAHDTFRNHTKVTNAPRDYGDDARLLAQLINAMRRDLKMPAGDIEARQARLWASGFPRSSAIK